MLILKFWCLFMVAVIFISVYLIAKCENAFKNREIIRNAISRFELDMLVKENYDTLKKINYGTMEELNDTVNRIWDWGYTRILPKEQFELIKPYISKRKHK